MVSFGQLGLRTFDGAEIKNSHHENLRVVQSQFTLPWGTTLGIGRDRAVCETDWSDEIALYVQLAPSLVDRSKLGRNENAAADAHAFLRF